MYYVYEKLNILLVIFLRNDKITIPWNNNQ